MAITWAMDFGATAAGDLQDPALVGMFIAANLERGYDFSGDGPFVAGFDIQDKTVWLDMQSLYLSVTPGLFTGSAWLRPTPNLTGVVTNSTLYNGPVMTTGWFI